MRISLACLFAATLLFPLSVRAAPCKELPPLKVFSNPKAPVELQRSQCPREGGPPEEKLKVCDGESCVGVKCGLPEDAAQTQLEVVPFIHDSIQDVVLVWRGGAGPDTLRVLTATANGKVVCRSNRGLDFTFKDATRKLAEGETLGPRFDAAIQGGQLVVTRGILARTDKVCCSAGQARIFMKMPETNIVFDRLERVAAGAPSSRAP